jgi:glycosyltransferase involved in cell wall biosynthesis
MTGQPRISLVVVLREGAADVSRAVAALDRQSFRNFELVVQHCAADRDALEALGAVAARRVDLATTAAASMAEAYNRAFERCQGPLLAMLDLDEWLDDTALEHFVRWFEEHRNAAFCYGATRVLSEGDAEIVRAGGFDFVRLLLSEFIPPVTAGCFNRMIIGPDLTYHEPAATAAPLDLFLRLGLRFDRTEIVEKAEVVCNRSPSMDGRRRLADDYSRELQDHAFVLHRFFVTQGNSRFNQYLHRVSLGRAYCRYAALLLERGAPMREVVHCLSEAARQEPGSEMVEALVGQLQGVSLDVRTGQVLVDDGRQPAVPPEWAEAVEGALILAEIRTEEYWPDAWTRREAGGMRVQTAPRPLSYASWLPLHLPSDMAERDWLWAEVALDVGDGQIGIAILDGSGNLRGEQLLSPGSARVFLQCGGSDRGVLIRTGAHPRAATVDVLEVRVRRMPMADGPRRSGAGS